MLSLLGGIKTAQKSINTKEYYTEIVNYFYNTQSTFLVAPFLIRDTELEIVSWIGWKIYLLMILEALEFRIKNLRQKYL